MKRNLLCPVTDKICRKYLAYGIAGKCNSCMVEKYKIGAKLK
jgi:hypothetical protein